MICFLPNPKKEIIFSNIFLIQLRGATSLKTTTELLHNSLALFASSESHSGVASSLGQSWRKECRRQREAITGRLGCFGLTRPFGSQVKAIWSIDAASTASAAATAAAAVVAAMVVTKKHVAPVRDGDSLSCGARPSFPGRQFHCNSWRTITKVSRDHPAIGPLRQRLKWPTYGMVYGQTTPSNTL